MSKKKINEWTVNTVWGKVAMLSWGEPDLPPVLLVHGFLDSAATFSLLVEQLPDTYFYVSLDFPGHGKSDHMPIGPLATQIIYIEVINKIVTEMRWDQFIMVTHSLGFICGIFYHNAFPGKISKMVNLDPFGTIANYQYVENDPSFWYKFGYEVYYDAYKRNFEEPRAGSRERMVRQVMKSRDLNREQAEVVLSRSLVQVGDDLYKYSWQLLAKRISQLPVHQDIAESVITTDPPPMLNLIATVNTNHVGLNFSKHIMARLQEDPKHSVVYLEGPHDFHITDAEKLAPLIVKFLRRRDNYKANL